MQSASRADVGREFETPGVTEQEQGGERQPENVFCPASGRASAKWSLVFSLISLGIKWSFLLNEPNCEVGELSLYSFFEPIC